MRIPPRAGVPPLRCLLALLVALACLTPTSVAQDFDVPPGFEVNLVGDNFGLGVGFAFAPDGTFYVCDKSGRVWYHDGLARQAPPCIDLADEVNLEGDRGLLGIALHPDFEPDGGKHSWMYLLYTVSPVFGEDLQYDENDMYSFSRVTRFRVTTDVNNLVRADVASRQVLLGDREPDGRVPFGIASLHSSHACGSLLFGSDGSLFVSNGDGAHFDLFDFGGNDTAGFDDFVHPVTGQRGPMPKEQDSGAFRSQDLRSLAGKVLRINPETGLGYSSNPFFDGDPASNPSRVWALGLRNPYRISLWPGTGAGDPDLGDPGALLIGDVGFELWEELNIARGGENFRWPCYEGPVPHTQFSAHDAGTTPFDYPDCADPIVGTPASPVLAWHHLSPGSLTPTGMHFDRDGSPAAGFTGSCAIGGVVVTGDNYPEQYTGQYFLFDFTGGWLKTMEFGPQGDLLAVRNFGEGFPPVIAVESHPESGEIYFLALDGSIGKLWRMRYGANATPIAAAEAQPTSGPSPLTVQFDGAGSFDPAGEALTFEWDFGDGSPGATGSAAVHTYATDGPYTAQLQVTDDVGLVGLDEVEIEVGAGRPKARIFSPAQGQTFLDGDVLSLISGNNPALSYEWTVDQFHDFHVHPSVFVSTSPTDQFAVEAHGGTLELFYFRITLTARNAIGLESTASVFVYPEASVFDISGTARIISRLDELSPPSPTGAGNTDIEVIRDGVRPPVGSTDPDTQFDTFHDGDQGSLDWIGFELAVEPGSEARFTALSFQEGLHYPGGGWFESLRVDVRTSGVWNVVEGLVITPGYSVASASQPGFDGTGFEQYTLQFDPTFGDAVRLRGTPGGADGFISVAELRAEMISRAPDIGPFHDVTLAGRIIGRVFELQPPGPTGAGNTNPETLRNGTYPQVGSTSALAQFDTFHGGDQNGIDWIGVEFEGHQVFGRLVFQEGLHSPAGGRFETVPRLQIRESAGGLWVDLQGVSVSPPYPGSVGFADSYETFVFEFDLTSGHAIRLIGRTEGADSFVSVGELRVFAAGGGAACSRGSGSNFCGANLNSTGQAAHASVEGCTSVSMNGFVLSVEALPPGATGIFFYGDQAVRAMPFGDGVRCVGGETGRLSPAFLGDGSGHAHAEIDLSLPPNPVVEILPGSTWHFQAWYRDALGGAGFNLSDGVTVTFVP